MAEYTELIKALRSASTVSTAWEKLMLDAAAAIEELMDAEKTYLAELAQCHENLRRAAEMIRERDERIEALRAQLEDRTNQDEQDKILEDLRNAPVRPIGPIEPMRIELLPERGEIVRCIECQYGITAHGISDGWVLCSKPYTERGNAMHRADWFCADGEMEARDGK